MPLKLNSSGGGSVTLNTASTASTITLNLPGVNGNIITSGDTGSINSTMITTNTISQSLMNSTSFYGGYGPSFAVYSTIAQTIGASWTKVQFNAEEWDTANCFDSSTNYRFTPNVAGYYQINTYVRPNNNYIQYCALYKNGTAYRYSIGSSYTFAVPLSTMIYCNGSTDYLEIYFFSATSIATSPGSTDTWWNGFLARPA